MIYKEYNLLVIQDDNQYNRFFNITRFEYHRNHLWAIDTERNEYVIPYVNAKQIKLELIKEEDSDDFNDEIGVDI